MSKYKADFIVQKDLGFSPAFEDSGCVICVSIGNPLMTGGKFKATLKLLNAPFKDCTVIIADTLRRHSLAIHEQNASILKLSNQALLLGDEWFSRNENVISEELAIPYRVMRWHHYLNSEAYPRYRTEVDELYRTSHAFKTSYT